MNRRIVVPMVVLLTLAVVAVGLYLFQPWRIFTSSTVTEDIPSVTETVTSAPAPSGQPSDEPSESSVEPSEPSVEPSPIAPREILTGQLISHEHASTGTAKIIELADGSQILRLENLDTSDGPDLRVWLTDAPVIEGVDGWHVFDDGAYLDLGALKANKGNHNYAIPSGVDLTAYSSVSVWCARFAVSFAAAELVG